jgi:hypothetical protein
MREYILCLEDSWGFSKSSEDVLRSTLTSLFSIKGLEVFFYYVSLHFELFSKIQIQNLKFLKHIAVDDQTESFAIVPFSGRSDFA